MKNKTDAVVGAAKTYLDAVAAATDPALAAAAAVATAPAVSGITAISDDDKLNNVFGDIGISWTGGIFGMNKQELAEQRVNESKKLFKLIFKPHDGVAGPVEAAPNPSIEFERWIDKISDDLKSKETARLDRVKEEEDKKAAVEAGQQRRSTRKKNIIQEAAKTTYSDWGERATTFSSLFKDFPIVNGTGARNLKKISPPSSVTKNIRKFFSELLYQLNLGTTDYWLGISRDSWIDFAQELRKSAGFGVSSRIGQEPQLPYADWLVALWQLTHNNQFVNIDSLKTYLPKNR